MILLILLILAFVCFVLAACNVGSRFNLTAAGLAFWVLTHLIPALTRAATVILALAMVGCAVGYEAKSGNKFTFSLTPTVQDYKAIKEIRQ